MLAEWLLGGGARWRRRMALATARSDRLAVVCGGQRLLRRFLGKCPL